ncbi:MAG: hypothetical protein SPK85_04580 [Prevotella sp.]|nr:hypothetical protein [Prevotella sp.]
MSKKIIFKNTEDIEFTIKKANEYVSILNDNYKRIKEENSYLNYKIAYYHTFYNPNRSNKTDFINKVYDEISKILDRNNPFNSAEMVEKFSKELNEKLHLNYYYDYNSNKTYYPNGKGGNIQTIRPSDFQFCERFITFDKKQNSFIVNEDELKKYEEQKTYYTLNKKQEKITELLQQIDERVNELNTIGYTDYLIYGGNCVPFNQIWHSIQNVK